MKEYGIVSILLLVVVLEQLAHLSSSTTHNNTPTCPLNVKNNGIIKATIIMRAMEWVVLIAETFHPLFLHELRILDDIICSYLSHTIFLPK